MTMQTQIHGIKVLDWTGGFDGTGKTGILVYAPSDGNWYLWRYNGNQLERQGLGNTGGFGRLDGGQPFWTGNFTQPNATDILFYSPGDDNWWLGTDTGSQLQWALVGNTKGFGHAINDGRPFWSGDFNGDGRADILFYYPGDDNWWLGTVINGQLQWSLVGNTKGFGHAINDGRPFWTGDFTGDGRADVLFYYPGDDNWWLGTVVFPPPENPQCVTLRAQIADLHGQIADLQQQLVGLDPRQDRVEIMRINAQIRTLQQTINGDQSQMQQLGCGVQPPAAKALQWSLVGNTKGFGHAINDGRPFWTGNFSRPNAIDIMFYYPGDDNWWLGTVINGQLQWSLVGNTKGFGHAINDGRPFWTGDFTGDGRADVLFYFDHDQHWWLGTITGGQLQWALVDQPPTVTGVFPNHGLAAGGTKVTIAGQNFRNGATVQIGNTHFFAVTYVSATTLTIVTGQNTPGTYAVSVINPDGEFGVLTDGFTYDPPPPAKVTVPKVVGETQTRAVTDLANAHLDADITNPPGPLWNPDLYTVTAQNPAAGAVVDEKTTVHLTISPTQGTQLPDLAIINTWIEPTEHPAPGQALTAYFSFANVGNAQAGKFTIRLQLDGGQSTDIAAGPYAAGAQDQVQWPFPSGLLAGDHHIYAYLDVKNEVKESNESNNIGYHGFSVSM